MKTTTQPKFKKGQKVIYSKRYYNHINSCYLAEVVDVKEYIYKNNIIDYKYKLKVLEIYTIDGVNYNEMQSKRLMSKKGFKFNRTAIQDRLYLQS